MPSEWRVRIAPSAARALRKLPRAVAERVDAAIAALSVEPRPPGALYWEFHERGFNQAIRRGNWKAVRKGTKKPVELYDLSEDLGETTDLAERYPDVARRATELIKREHVDSEESPVKEKGRVGLDAVEQLCYDGRRGGGHGDGSGCSPADG